MDKKMPDRIVRRVNALMQDRRINWGMFKKRYLGCPWCGQMFWKMVCLRDPVLVLCMKCYRPYTIDQIINSWVEREASIALKRIEARFAKGLDVKRVKKGKDKSDDSNDEVVF